MKSSLRLLFAFVVLLCFCAFKTGFFEVKEPAVVGAPPPLLPVPTEQQLAWHNMELNAFIHFTTNTFTGLEWGNGDESPAVFNPSQLDASQWVSVLKAAGFRQVILTCKHHDGFCLWPSAFTEHSVKRSPYKGGKGDVVQEVADACRKQGMKFGVYLSPWDRNHANYGQPAYLQYYRNQLQELFTRYGKVSEMWFDGANGGKGYYGGANETRKINSATYYDWPNTLDLVRKIQPTVLFFSDAGPDLRWVGNERGTAGITNWNTINNDTLHAGKAGIENLLNTGTEDGKKWIPAEVDVSIRPGWFYHQQEDSLVKSAERLFEVYLSSVGRGSTLLLNVPPDRRGLIHENDIRSLKGFRRLLDEEFKTDLARQATIKASAVRGNSPQFAASMVNDGKKETYWSTDDGANSGSLELHFGKVQKVKYLMMQEYIRLGQRVKNFSVETWQDGAWKEVAAGTTVGYKRILKIPSVTTDRMRVNIIESKACPVISTVSVY